MLLYVTRILQKIVIVVTGMVDAGEMVRNGLMMILGFIPVMEKMGIQTFLLKYRNEALFK